MARTYTVSPLFHLVPRTRRVNICPRNLRATVSLWRQVALLSTYWASGSWGPWAPPRSW